MHVVRPRPNLCVTVMQHGSHSKRLCLRRSEGLFEYMVEGKHGSAVHSKRTPLVHCVAVS